MMLGTIDLNSVENNDGGETAVGGGEVCLELWQACAGPLVTPLPNRGNAVVYFPQGHLDHLHKPPATPYLPPPHVFCRVVDVKLHGDAASEEVYAQVSLVPDQQIEEKWKGRRVLEAESGDEDAENVGKPMIPHMFCKTLTASDTSTHGGFSVPRRAAEDCFPPLDYKQQRPSQELVAKDLHGVEWKFRHIYRGQPRRHLLTTGWSAFVNKKKLTSGDAVLFLRGGDGELRLGIRRAAQFKSRVNILPPDNFQQLNASSTAAVLNAISMKSVFNICYNPRGCSSDIILPFHKFSKSLASSFSSGMRFKFRLETEDSPEKRCSGLIVGVSDADPIRWPGSKWKCLLVRWDDMKANCLNRVSPWDIESSNSGPGPRHSLFMPSAKRPRDSFPSMQPDFSTAGDGVENSDEPFTFQKVLQGQEVFVVGTPLVGGETSGHCGSKMRCFPGLSPRNPLTGSMNSLEGNLFGTPLRYQKVLQGQETVSILPYGRGLDINKMQRNITNNVLNGVLIPSLGYSRFTNTDVNGTHMRAKEVNNQDSFWSPRQITKQFPSFDNGYESGGGLKEHHWKDLSHLPQSFGDGNIPVCKNSCMLFGFSLTEGKVAGSNQDKPPSVMIGSCTKISNVHPVRDSMLLDIAL